MSVTHSKATIDGVERVYADVGGKPDYRLVQLAEAAGAKIEPCELPPRGHVYVAEHLPDGRVVTHLCEGGKPSETLKARARGRLEVVTEAAVKARAQVARWRELAKAGELDVPDGELASVCAKALGFDDTAPAQLAQMNAKAKVQARIKEKRQATRALRELAADFEARSDWGDDEKAAMREEAESLAEAAGVTLAEVRQRLNQKRIQR